MSDRLAGCGPAAEPPLRDQFYPPEFREAEDLLRARRRTQAEAQVQPDDPALGAAFSGGGIRSATFGLGLLQALARTRLLGRVDYLSTVSGGGYIGGFLGALYTNRKDARQVAAELCDPFSPPLRWLRENGRHLAPNGAGDLLSALAEQLRNWCSLTFVMALFALTGFLGAAALRTGVDRIPGCSGFLQAWFPVPDAGVFWWWSPYLLPPAPILAVGLLLGGCYWLIPVQTAEKWVWPWRTLLVVVLLCGAGLAARPASLERYTSLETGLLVGGLAAFGLQFALLFGSGWRGPDRKEAVRKLRGWLTSGLARALVVAAALLVFGLIDSLGQSLYLGLQRGSLRLTLALLWTATGASALLSLGTRLEIVRKLIPQRRAWRLPLSWLAAALALLILALGLVNLSLLAHAIAWNWDLPGGRGMALRALTSVFAFALALSWALGRQMNFLNKSSLQQLYGSRLGRAYLGASNPRRHDRPEGNAVTRMIPGDDLWWDSYVPEAHGGPLHLINVTINETCSARSQIEQRDRKGLQMAVGPAGISVERTQHALWNPGSKRGGSIIPLSVSKKPRFTVLAEQLDADQPNPTPAVAKKDVSPHDVERISVGHWIALSGAAFGTGLGSRTQLGFSLLAGLANVRLGYWWNSFIDPRRRDASIRTPFPLAERLELAFNHAFPVQAYVLDEWLARFRGPARKHWYLSDGGHFENTALYELIRRRVPYILCCDSGEDAQFRFDDVANLVRKARIDFNAEVVFCDREKLRSLKGGAIPDEAWEELGTPEDFAKARRRKHGLLARVRYPDGGRGEEYSAILFVKPALSGDEPADLRNYQAVHPAFPHEPTTDQFFNEAQWESYRALGEHSGGKLFALNARGVWWFTALDRRRL